MLSESEYPTPSIVIRGPDDSTTRKPIARSEAVEGLGSPGVHEDDTASATSAENTPESTPSNDRNGYPQRQLKPIHAVRSRKYEDSRAVRQTRRNLGRDLSRSDQDSSRERLLRKDKTSEPIHYLNSESNSWSSSCSDDSDSDAEQLPHSSKDQDGLLRGQIGLTGEQNASGDLNTDPIFEGINGPLTKPSAAEVAPFRGDGGIPSIQKDPRKLEIRSEITDFGESLYAKVGQSRSRNSSFSVTSPVAGRQHSKKLVGTLQERLFQALVPTQEELSKHLADVHSKETIADYASKICGTSYEEDGSRKVTCFRKIFVILVLIDKTRSITKFIDIGISDSDLPLVLAKRMDSKGSKELRLSRNPEKHLSCFSKQWKQLHFRNFEHYQWTTLSPFFAKGGYKQVKHYPLQDQAILPFISCSPDEGRIGKTLAFEGGFSRVSKIDIHPDHHNFGSNCESHNTRSFAVKCLHSRDKKQFKKEVEMLKRFSDPDVPTNRHLVSLLATYRQFGAYFLIFHWADADLRRYWMEVKPTPTMDRDTVLWVAQQCRGIAEGVVAIHQYKSSKLRPQPKDEAFGHHGDIKPENVLWFPDKDHASTKQGTLKLSDFGLAEMSVHHTRSMQPKSNFATSRSYQAPEVEIDGTGAIGRSYDMWTLGCLYLEFITWLMGGWDLVGIFSFDRMKEDCVLGQDCPTFYVLKPEIPGRKHRAEIKPCVSRFISQLLAKDSCTAFLRDFIEMVRDDLLVIKATDPQKRDRATCQEVLTRLGNMLHRCEHSNGYGYKETSSPGRHE
ncbi:hypothetical protein ONS95_001828 [Cadophora gregata]|uniref:uncharacterized protein n=1 Tax=Cadophora gregata TaxID=51156 RepID=UPI0026DD9B05|nr:uncharacterized protein ONS95_001828 [Cadophora gregata]KAK0111473.1 hypothetical protein ONS95_001828 [Cadophora gregata]